MKWLGGALLLLAVLGGNLLYRRRVLQTSRRRHAWITLLGETARQVACFGTPLDTVWRDARLQTRQLCCAEKADADDRSYDVTNRQDKGRIVDGKVNPAGSGVPGRQRADVVSPGTGRDRMTVSRFCDACRTAAESLPPEEERMLLYLCERCEGGSTDRALQVSWLNECRAGLQEIADREDPEIAGRLRRCGMLSICGTLAFLLLVW